jgi:hypothetical protein
VSCTVHSTRSRRRDQWAAPGLTTTTRSRQRTHRASTTCSSACPPTSSSIRAARPISAPQSSRLGSGSAAISPPCRRIPATCASGSPASTLLLPGCPANGSRTCAARSPSPSTATVSVAGAPIWRRCRQRRGRYTTSCPTSIFGVACRVCCATSAPRASNRSR